MTIARADFASLFEEIWTGVGLSAPVAEPEATLAREGAVTLTGQVGLAGEWSGAVLVEMSEALAITMAAAMFGLEADELEEDDVTDAVGELANMLAGKVKARLGIPTSLSLPSVTAGDGYRVWVQGSKVVCELLLRCGDEIAAVRLLEGTTGQG